MVKSIRILEAGHCHHPEFLVRSGGGSKSIRFPASVVVIEHSKEGIILFDVGYPSDIKKITARFPEKLYSIFSPVSIDSETTAVSQLQKIGIKKTDVSHIIFSHLHVDHVGGARDFPSACYHYSYDALVDYLKLPKLKISFLQLHHFFSIIREI